MERSLILSERLSNIISYKVQKLPAQQAEADLQYRPPMYFMEFTFRKSWVESRYETSSGKAKQSSGGVCIKKKRTAAKEEEPKPKHSNRQLENILVTKQEAARRESLLRSHDR